MPRVILSLVEAKNTMNIADMSICLESETVYLFFFFFFFFPSKLFLQIPAEFYRGTLQLKAHKANENFKKKSLQSKKKKKKKKKEREMSSHYL